MDIHDWMHFIAKQEGYDIENEALKENLNNEFDKWMERISLNHKNKNCSCGYKQKYVGDENLEYDPDGYFENTDEINDEGDICPQRRIDTGNLDMEGVALEFIRDYAYTMSQKSNSKRVRRV